MLDLSFAFLVVASSFEGWEMVAAHATKGLKFSDFDQQWKDVSLTSLLTICPLSGFLKF